MTEPLDAAIMRNKWVPCQRCGKKRRALTLRMVALGDPLPMVRWCEKCIDSLSTGSTADGPR